MRRFLALAVLLLSAVTVTAAQEIEVPMETQVPILLKVLGFDRRISERPGEPLRIGILYQPGVRSSRTVYSAFTRAAEESGIRSVAGRPVMLVPIEVKDEAEITSSLATVPVDVLYVAPLRAVRISVITDIARRRQLMTLTGVTDYVAAGLTVGLDIRGKRPEIVVNLASMRAAHGEFSAQLLKMVRIIQ